MALSPFLYHWLLLFLPYQSLAQCRLIFDFLADLTLYRSVTAQRKVYLLYLIYTVYCTQYVYLWAALPPPIERFLHGDIISVSIQEDAFYLVQIALVPMMMYFFEQLFFTMKPAFLRLLEDTLFVDRDETLQGVSYGTVSEQTTARCIVLGLLNLLHVFMLAIDAVLLFGLFKLITTAIQSPVELVGSPLETPFTFTWNVFWMLTSTWSTATVFATFSKLLINVAGFGASFICILFCRLYHSETILAAYKRKGASFSWVPFGQYLVYSGQTFRILFTANDMFGRLFFAFLLFNMPISAWVLVQLALGGLSQRSRIILILWAGHELFACILLHWAFAKFTKRLHRPSKTLLRLNASTGHRVGNFRARLLLHHTIVRLHTKAKYGFTYGSVGGLITFDSFAKCMFLYIELLMYAYTLIRGI